MRDENKTKRQLIDELVQMRRRVAELQAAEFKLQRVAEALRQSEIQFRKITEKSIVGVYLIQDEVFRYVNPKMAEIFGFTVDELVDIRGPQDVVAEEDWPLVRDNLRMRIAGQMESINYPFRGKKKHGEIIHIEVYGSRMDYFGRPAVIGTILDMTQRIRAERRLERQLRRFQALHHLAVAMTAEHTLEENLSLLVEKSRELLETDSSFIALCDPKSQTLHVSAHAGLSSDDVERLNSGFSSLSDHPKTSTGTESDWQPKSVRCSPTCEEMLGLTGMKSGMSATVKIREREFGVLCAADREERSFSASNKDLLLLLGNMAALEATRKQAEEALAQSEEQLRSLSRQLLRAQEDERKRVARELHDGIGQSVTAIKFEVENVIRKMSVNVPSEHFAPMQSLLTVIQNVVEEVGQIAMDLRPSILDDLGVLATIAWLCREFRKTHPHIEVLKNLELKENEISDDQKIVVFRILQEAFNNIAKHSCADQVQVLLRKRIGGIELCVRDDGVGFDLESVSSAASNRRGLGLASMKERAQLSGGSFAVLTQPGSGTVITASWPGG